MSGGSGQGGSGSDNTVGWLILGAVGLLLAYGIWIMFDDQIKNAIRWIRVGEMSVISLITSKDYTVGWTGPDGKIVPINFHDWYAGAPVIPVENLDGQTIHILSTLALDPIKFPLMALMVVMGLWALFKGPRTTFRRRMDLNGLIRAQAQNFPYIAPFIKFNPQEQPFRAPGSPVPAELPLFSEALGPEEWLAYNEIPIPDGKVDSDAVYKALAQQLGPRWKGPSDLPPYKQILLAAFCLKAARKRDQSDEMLGRASRCWDPKGGFQLSRDRTLLKEARAILKDEKLSGKTLAKSNQHAFQTTALLRALQTAREEGGVLAPAQFVWLRGHDRVLWYPLNNLGRQAFHMEALGAMSHFKAEKLTQRPIPRPKLDGAISSVSSYMESDRARPVPQLDYSQSKKRGIKTVKAG